MIRLRGVIIFLFSLTLLAIGFGLLVSIYDDIISNNQFPFVTFLHVIGFILLLVSAYKINRDSERQLLNLKNQISSAERDVAEKSKELTALLNNIPCAIATINTDYRIRNVNAELTNLTGVEKEYALGKRCYDVFGFGQICPDCPVERAIESGKMQQNVKIEINRMDKEIYIEQIAIPILNSESAIDYVLEIVVDATEKVGLRRQHDNLFIQTITALVQIIESRDTYTGFHSNRVRDIAVEIGKELGLEPSKLDELSFAAALHDIGKIGIPEHILNKPGNLTVEEFAIIKKHPTIGYNALKDVDSMKKVASIILDHHERMDGKGYPAGKKAEEISLASRILSVADVYEAITADRVYRKAMSEEAAINILNAGRGTQFDPQVVAALIKVITKQGKADYQNAI